MPRTMTTGSRGLWLLLLLTWRNREVRWMRLQPGAGGSDAEVP